MDNFNAPAQPQTHPLNAGIAAADAVSAFILFWGFMAAAVIGLFSVPVNVFSYNAPQSNLIPWICGIVFGLASAIGYAIFIRKKFSAGTNAFSYKGITAPVQLWILISGITGFVLFILVYFTISDSINQATAGDFLNIPTFATKVALVPIIISWYLMLLRRKISAAFSAGEIVFTVVTLVFLIFAVVLLLFVTHSELAYPRWWEAGLEIIAGGSAYTFTARLLIGIKPTPSETQAAYTENGQE